MQPDEIHEDDVVTVTTPQRKGYDGSVILPGEKAYVIQTHTPRRKGEVATSVRVRCPETSADMWLDVADLVPYEESQPAQVTLPKVGDWFRFEGLEGQAEGLLFMKVEWIVDWGEVGLSRHTADGDRMPEAQFTRNIRQIPLPNLLSMIGHGVLVPGKPGEDS